ncbi:MAG: LysR family transcriptional regulator [Gemmatimonadetes bacterium]|nr:LysR family transcriptional regulator [Gemmatimonadota bacterium]
MELRQLRYFVAVAEELHFTRAARHLRIAQPALSQQIAKLEDELDVKLLWRTKRRVELTHAGRIFLAEAQQILSRADGAVHAAQGAEAGQIGRIAVACGPVASYVGLPGVLHHFRLQFPDVELTLREYLVTDVVLALEQGTADVGLVVPYFDSRLLQRETVLQVPLLAALPESHALAGSRQISLQQLSGDPFVLFPQRKGSGFYERIMSVCQRAGFTPRVLEGVEHLQTLLFMVAAGYGVSLVPATLNLPGAPGVSHARVRESYATLELCLAWRTDEPSPLVAGFLRAVREWCRVEPAARRFLPKPRRSP